MNHPAFCVDHLCLVLTTSAANPQDKKPPAEFADRPAPPVSAETRKEMEARLGEARRRSKPNQMIPAREFGSDAGSLISVALMRRLKSIAKG